MKSPLVSVLMPVLNGGPDVTDAVRSIVAQTESDWELVVIDDGSSDGTADRIARIGDPRIRLIRGQETRGLPTRLNEAVRLANGAFFARMDGDDVSYPTRFERQLDWLASHPMTDVVATDMLVVRPDGTPSGKERWRGAAHSEIVSHPWSGFHFNHATWMGRAGWFRRYRYDARAVRTEDDDLLLRAYRNSRFYRLPEVLYAYRVGAFSAGGTSVARRSFVRSLVRRAMEQRDYRLLRGVPIQWAKSAAEKVAQLVGQESLVTRHRDDGNLNPGVLEAYQAAIHQLRSDQVA